MGFERREVLTVCLNPAWQKTLVFGRLQVGAVNRAESLIECGGGKGVNAARALRAAGAPVAAAVFWGGHTGERLLSDLAGLGVRPVAVEVGAPTRTCTTLVDLARRRATELIEPSAPVPEKSAAELLAAILEAVSGAAAVALCGTAPPGIRDDFYAQVAAAARQRGVPVLLDTVKEVRPTLAAGVDVLKVNAGELRELTGETDPLAGARQCRARFGVTWVGVTDGPRAAWLVGPGTVRRFATPRLRDTRSTVGAGDCATGILLGRLPLAMGDEEAVAAAFADALAAATASCLTDIPASFDPAEAARLRPRLRAAVVRARRLAGVRPAGQERTRLTGNRPKAAYSTPGTFVSRRPGQPRREFSRACDGHQGTPEARGIGSGS